MTDTSPAALVRNLIDLLDLEELDRDLYRGKRQPGGVGRVFGGQVVAQALQAAQRSTEAPKAAHSLHAYFMRPGSEELPILFRVERDFDGRSFATRRVIALQRGEPILTLTASFHSPGDGLHHQAATMPDVEPPEDLPNESDVLAAHADQIPEAFRAVVLRPRATEIRRTGPEDWIESRPREPFQANWMRLPAPIGDDPALHRAVLAYLSDMKLMATGMRPHGYGFLSRRLTSASLDHALWFHEPFRADEWLLYVNTSPWAGHDRGFNHGQFFTRDGRLVASVAQEGLMRESRPRA